VAQHRRAGLRRHRGFCGVAVNRAAEPLFPHACGRPVRRRDPYR
jgi:hypothetical protein